MPKDKDKWLGDFLQTGVGHALTYAAAGVIAFIACSIYLAVAPMDDAKLLDGASDLCVAVLGIPLFFIVTLGALYLIFKACRGVSIRIGFIYIPLRLMVPIAAIVLVATGIQIAPEVFWETAPAQGEGLEQAATFLVIAVAPFIILGIARFAVVWNWRHSTTLDDHPEAKDQ